MGTVVCTPLFPSTLSGSAKVPARPPATRWPLLLAPPSPSPPRHPRCSHQVHSTQTRAMGHLGPWARYGLLLGAHLLLLGLGAVVLQGLEGPPALRLQTQLQAELAAFQARHAACLAPGALEELLGTALAAQARGVSILASGSEAETWDLPSALLFAASLLTTTGYGHMAPLSAGGKAFCVVYAALGLLASLALGAALRHRLLPMFDRLCAWVVSRWPLAPARVVLLRAAGLGLLVAGALVLLPALVLWAARAECSFLEALYFCFGSLSTLGLEDLLSSGGRGLHPALYYMGQLALLGYLLLGLLAVLLAVETLSELPQSRALVSFFGAEGPPSAHDQAGILGQDELALRTRPPGHPPQHQDRPQLVRGSGEGQEQRPECLEKPVAVKNKGAKNLEEEKSRV